MKLQVKSNFISRLSCVIVFVSLTGCLPELPAPNSKPSLVVSLVCDLTDGCSNVGKPPIITFSPPAGTYGTSDNVTDITISSLISGAKICYTIDNTDPDLAGITILRCVDPCFPSGLNDPLANRIDLGVVTSYTDASLTNGAKYNYLIYSKDIAGNYSSAYYDDATPKSGLLYMYVTNLLYSGNLGGVAGADARCNSDSAKPIPNATYKALLVDGINRIACTTTNVAQVQLNILIGF